MAMNRNIGWLLCAVNLLAPRFVAVGQQVLRFDSAYVNQGSGKKRVAFAAPYPGKILPMDLKQLGGTLLCQKDSFLCAARGVSLGIAFQ